MNRSYIDVPNIGVIKDVVLNGPIDFHGDVTLQDCTIYGQVNCSNLTIEAPVEIYPAEDDQAGILITNNA